MMMRVLPVEKLLGGKRMRPPDQNLTVSRRQVLVIMRHPESHMLSLSV